jgi:hypothetical protein
MTFAMTDLLAVLHGPTASSHATPVNCLARANVSPQCVTGLEATGGVTVGYCRRLSLN